ncbi:hypothetical protein TPL01_22160 [Sulfuriferula plumbiphila]|uniref:ATPase n=1 Tax=Sulfuriferula plumbiphila TaxID=171865 RepID=A0A512L9A9_9PROT|nr:ATP-binding protein [Sulfuriferula plumbiphila]BBP03000.1 hypothetical protein SFPGR_04220 [Sulfuriferula plumbiphila]GEP31078.1 hypothetical protein TPL01_22160 [Sulfuriferula plumbiphila]
MQIQVRINEEGALRNQRYAFTDKFTLISELMQNARRAGARRIEISYDETSKILRVVDDGCGISDFQKLLTFNESGWDKDTCDEERPFGIGFSKCLYSASRCIVASRNRKIDFLTEEALSRRPIDVVDIEHHPHTVIELHDVQLPGLKNHLETMCSGFPVAVWLNGIELPRIHAIGHLPFVSANIGHVYLTGTRDGKHASDTLVFLQGFCVMRSSYFDAAQVNVVHLDSKEFVARLPDRDKLIDEDDQRKRIDACLKSLWRQALLEAKAGMEAEAFVDTFFEAMRRWGHLDLLNAIPLLPKCLCERIVGYPIQEGYEDCDYLETVQRFLTRSDIEEGSVVLVELDNMSDESAACWMVARTKGYIVISSTSLHHDHWVQRYVRTIDEQAARVEAVGEHCRATLEGRWIWPQVILCDAVSVTIGDDRVDLTEDGVYHDGSLFIPSGECSGEPVRQASSFIDEHDQFLEDQCDADRDALVDLIRRLRSVDPKATLDSLLQELKLEKYPLLQGKTFQLRVGQNCGEHAVELIG